MFVPCPPPPSPRFYRWNSQHTAPVVAALFALLLTAVFYLPGGNSGRVAEAQASQTIQVTPSTFSTYFDIDATTQVATLKGAYKSDITLELSTGEYLNAVHIDGASNLVIRGGNAADSGEATIIKVNKVFEDANGAGKAAILAVSNSTDVTIERLKFDFTCVRQVAPESEPDGLNRALFYNLYGIFFKDSTGTISSNVLNDYWSMLGDLRVLGKAGTLRLENEYNPPDQTAHFAEVDAYCDAFGTPPTNARFPSGVRSTLNTSTFRTIRVDTSSTYIPIIDANGKVTNPVRIRIADNELKRLQRVAIQVLGYVDADIIDNTIENANVSIDISGGASGRVDGNEITTTTVGVVYAPAWGLPVAPAGRTIEARLRVEKNEFDRVSSASVALGFYYCTDATRDGTTVHTNAEIIGNYVKDSRHRDGLTTGVNIILRPTFPYTFGPVEGTERLLGDITNCVGDDNERTRANIIGNTFAQLADDSDDPRGIDLKPIAILAGPTPDLPGYSAWFEVNAHYNEFIGYGWGARIESGRPGSISHGRVNASNNNWGTGAMSPAELVDDRVGVPAVAGITYEPWLETTSSLTGWLGDFGTGKRRFTGFSVNPDQYEAQNDINKLAPTISEFTIGGGETVRIGIVPYGRQDIIDNALIDGKVDVVWTVDGGRGDFREADTSLDSDNAPDDRVILFTAPDAPGTYMIHGTLDSCGAKITVGVEFTVDCRATFTAIVRRPSARVLEPTAAPTNPVGDIPTILVDADGGQYEVFTPEEGGSFMGEGFSIIAAPAVVPNGELVGIRMAVAGAASNVGMTAHRYTLGGKRYEISAVGTSGAAIESYVLKAPAEVCVPLPAVLSSNIRDIALVAINPDASLTILSARVKVGGPSLRVCANLSTLPATVAVGTTGAPDALPTETPDQETETLPDTGDFALPFGAATAIIMLILGVVAISMLGFILPRRVSS